MKMIDLEHNLGINLTDSQDDKVNGAYPYNDKVGLLNENVDKSNTYYQITDKKNLRANILAKALNSFLKERKT